MTHIKCALTGATLEGKEGAYGIFLAPIPRYHEGENFLAARKFKGSGVVLNRAARSFWYPLSIPFHLGSKFNGTETCFEALRPEAPHKDYFGIFCDYYGLEPDGLFDLGFERNGPSVMFIAESVIYNLQEAFLLKKHLWKKDWRLRDQRESDKKIWNKLKGRAEICLSRKKPLKETPFMWNVEDYQSFEYGFKPEYSELYLDPKHSPDVENYFLLERYIDSALEMTGRLYQPAIIGSEGCSYTSKFIKFLHSNLQDPETPKD